VQTIFEARARECSRSERHIDRVDSRHYLTIEDDLVCRDIRRRYDALKAHQHVHKQRIIR